MPRIPQPQPTWSANDRYNSDPEFRKQVDEGRERARRESERVERDVADALDMVKTRRKIY